MNVLKKTKYKRVVIIFLIFLIAGFVYMGNSNNDSKPSKVDTKISDIRREIEDDIAKTGAEAAYEKIKTKYGNQYYLGHDYTHIFGELIYKNRGKNGVNICDESFGFGCFHGFFTAALIDKGINVLPELERSCTDGELTACEHGLGHGVLEYVGRKNIDKALAECAGLDWKKKLWGCQDGVFMEYFLPNQGINEAEVVKFEKDNPYDICEDIDPRFAYACYWALGQWWVDIGIDFEQQGKYCLVVDDELKRTTCYLGVGNRVFHENHEDVGESIKTCNLMPEGGRGLCVSMVRSYLTGKDNDTDVLCGHLRGKDYDVCVSNREIIEKIIN